MARKSMLGVDPMGFLGQDAVGKVQRYFDPNRKFTGRRFEFLGGGGDRPEVAHEFTGDDIVAVSMLSVAIPPEASIEILDTKKRVLNELLREIPLDLPLWDAGDDVLDTKNSAAGQLWTALERITGVGWVTANKLLARKRPALLPVYDRVVNAALQPPRKAFWLSLRNSLQADGGVVVDRLGEIRDAADLSVTPSLLRVLDVAVWMTSQP